MISLNAKVVNVVYGKNFKLVNPCNLYGCTFGDDVFIGPFVEVQKGVNVGSRTKIQSHTFVCELVEIGSDCFIGHGVVFINDTFSTGRPSGGDSSKWRRTRVGSNVSIGSNATILPVKICDGTVIGAGSVVAKDIEVPGIYAGNPATFIRDLEVKNSERQ